MEQKHLISKAYNQERMEDHYEENFGQSCDWRRRRRGASPWKPIHYGSDKSGQATA
jgi:hypothetical protein